MNGWENSEIFIILSAMHDALSVSHRDGIFYVDNQRLNYWNEILYIHI